MLRDVEGRTRGHVFAARAQPINELQLVEELQTREELTPDAVEDYAKCYARKDGDGLPELPPVEAFDVGGVLHVVNGFHRVSAAIKAGNGFIRVAVVGSGTMDEARWVASSKNKAHGVRRTNLDKRRAIRMALDSGIGVEQSSRTIAEHVGVSKDLVSEVRAEWEAANAESIGGKANTTVTTKDGRQYPKTRSKRDDVSADNGVQPERKPKKAEPTPFEAFRESVEHIERDVPKFFEVGSEVHDAARRFVRLVREHEAGAARPESTRERRRRGTSRSRSLQV